FTPQEFFGFSLQALAFGDVARDFGGPHYAPACIPDRRDAKRDIDFTTVLGLTNSLKMLNLFASPDSAENEVFLGLTVRGNDQADRLPYGFRSTITEHPLGRMVPRNDDAVQRFADDRVVGRFDNGR